MPGLAELQNNPEYEKLSPEAKLIVFDKLSAQDEGYGKLSPEAQSLVRARLAPAPRSAATSQPKQRQAEPWTPYNIDQAKKGVAGLVSLPGLAVDLFNLPLQGINALTGGKLGDTSYPFMGSRNLYEGASRSLHVQNVPVPKDEYGKPDKGAEYVGTVSNFLAANALPGTGAVMLATRKAPVAITEILGTLLSATSAVEGKELGEEFLAGVGGLSKEEAGHVGSMIGAVAGPSVVGKVAHASAGSIERATDWLKEKLGISGFSAEAQKQAGAKLAGTELSTGLQASPLAGPNMQRSAELSGVIPGFQPTLGQASGAPGVIAIERRLATKSPESLARAAGREEENLQAVKDFEGKSFPPSPASVTQPALDRYKAIAAQREMELAGTDKQIAALADRYGYQPNAATGAKLRELRDQREQQVRGIKNQKYAAVDEAAAKAGITDDVSDVKRLISEVAGSDANAAQIMPELFGDMQSAIRKYAPKASAPASAATLEKMPGLARGGAEQTGPITVPFAALQSMLRRANADLNRAQLSGDATKAYYVAKVRDFLQGKVAKFEGAEYGDVATMLKDANNFWKTEYKEVFKEGAGGRMGQFNRWGDVTADEDVVRKLLFKANNEQGVNDFMRIYGDHPEAAAHLENGIKDVFAKSVVRDGEIQPRLVESFMRQYSQALDRLPKLKAELSNVDKANDALLSRRKVIEEEQKMLDKTALSRVAQIRDTDTAITAALKDPDQMRALLSQASKNPEASKALARSIADVVGRQNNSYEYLVANERTLKPVMDKLGAGHWDNVKYIAEARDILSRNKAPEHVELNKLQDIGEKTIGTPVKSVFSIMRQIATQGPARVSPEYATLHLGGRYIFKVKQAEAEKLLEDAIYDPKLAASLRSMQTNPTKGAIDEFKLNAFAHGVRVLDYAVQQTNEAPSEGRKLSKPIKKAIGEDTGD